MIDPALTNPCLKKQDSLAILTYNMHGYNQGSTLLQEICKSRKYDVIFIQEHWLTPPNMTKIININDNYVGFGISAMETAVSQGLLRGRPWGGVSVLVKSDLAPVCKNISVFERVVSITICDVLFINAYLPCEDGSIDALNLLHEILANMSNIIETSIAERMVFGGDLNVNISKNSPHALAINDFLSTYNIKKGYSDILRDDQLQYTFGNEKSNRFSVIDFLCVSENLLQCVKSYEVICDVNNFSDHSPVLLTIV